MKQSNPLLITSLLYLYKQTMTAHLSIDLRIRTEESDQYSVCQSEVAMIEHSIDSISILDESVTMHIQNLQRMEEKIKQPTKRSISSRSHSYIYINDEDNQLKRKSKSMKTAAKTPISLENVPHATMTQLLSYHRTPNLAKTDVYNRAYGAMFGFLIGDSIGSTIVNRSYNQEQILNAIMMKGGGVLNLKSGEGTDQWEICLALCQGLIEGEGAYDCNKVALKYLEWIESNPTDLPVLMGISLSDIKKRHHNRGQINSSAIGGQLRSGSLRNIKHESVLGIIRIIPLTIWGLKLQEYEFNHIIKQQMKFITPNEFVVQTSLVFANLLKCIILNGDHKLAYHQASQNIYKFGSQKMIQLWNSIQQNRDFEMTNSTANNLKFPMAFAINQLLEIDDHKDLKKSFIESTIRVLSKGFNTDTNCSVVLGLIGAIIGYNNIPSYFRTRVINSESSEGFRTRNRSYSSKKIVDIVGHLLKKGPTHLENSQR